MPSGMKSDTAAVDMENSDEAEVLATLKEHAQKALESDLLASATEVGLQQVRSFFAQCSF